MSTIFCDSDICNHPDEIKNLIVQWDKINCCEIKNNIINLGVERADPSVYIEKYGSNNLITSQELPEICNEVQMLHQMPLAADNEDFKYYMELEGDIYALSFLDLEKEGLSEYKKYLLMINNNDDQTESNFNNTDELILPSPAETPSQFEKYIEDPTTLNKLPIVNTVFHDKEIIIDNKQKIVDISKFPENEISELRQAFTLFDLKGNGYLTKEEIGAVLRNLAQYPTDEELEKMFVDIDQDGDGQLSFIEFVKLMYNMGNISEKSEEEEEAELKAAFKKAGITIQLIENDDAAKTILKNHQTRLNTGCPDDSVWIVLTLSSHITSVFHLEMLNYVLRPSYDYQEPSFISHSLKHISVEVNAKKRERKCYFKHVARVVNFFVKLMDKQLQKRVKCTILYATETGKSECFAKSLTEIFKHSFNAKCLNIKDYDISNLENESLLFIITSTFGNGDPPENDEDFKKKIFGMKRNKCLTKSQTLNCNDQMKSEKTTDSPSLYKNNLKFAVFGLGNSSYPKYCAYAKFLDCCLAESGAERIHCIGLGDELCGQEESFRKWSISVFKESIERFKIKTDLTFIETFWDDVSYNPQTIRLKAANDNTKSEQLDLCETLGKLHNRNIRPCKLSSIRNLQNSEESKRVTLDAALDGQGFADVLSYEPGDHIGIFAPNRKDFVDFVISRMKNSPGENEICEIEVLKDINTVIGVKKQWLVDERFPPFTIRFALTHLLDLTTPVSQNILKHFSKQATDEKDRLKLKKLAKDHLEYEYWKKSYPNLVETLEEFPSVFPDASLLVTQLPKLHARVYSISSCPQDITTDDMHITVGVVEYQYENKAIHYGVCSKWLENLAIGEVVPAFVRGAPSFHLPEDKTLPIIMVGAGTGIAPFRSFWQKRKLDFETIKETPVGENIGWGEMVLYFGCRQCRIDELYRSEIDNMIRKNIITSYYGAYSREPNLKKTYVQDLINMNLDQIHDLLVKKKGHIYICGDVRMAEEVTNVIENGLMQVGNFTYEEAKFYINEMKENQRFHEDIFGNSSNINQCKTSR